MHPPLLFLHVYPTIPALTYPHNGQNPGAEEAAIPFLLALGPILVGSEFSTSLQVATAMF